MDFGQPGGRREVVSSGGFSLNGSPPSLRYFGLFGITGSLESTRLSAMYSWVRRFESSDGCCLGSLRAAASKEDRPSGYDWLDTPIPIPGLGGVPRAMLVACLRLLISRDKGSLASLLDGWVACLCVGQSSL